MTLAKIAKEEQAVSHSEQKKIFSEFFLASWRLGERYSGSHSAPLLRHGLGTPALKGGLRRREEKEILSPRRQDAKEEFREVFFSPEVLTALVFFAVLARVIFLCVLPQQLMQ
jgi:hypothetical protein